MKFISDLLKFTNYEFVTNTIEGEVLGKRGRGRTMEQTLYVLHRDCKPLSQEFDVIQVYKI